MVAEFIGVTFKAGLVLLALLVAIVLVLLAISLIVHELLLELQVRRSDRTLRHEPADQHNWSQR